MVFTRPSEAGQLGADEVILVQNLQAGNYLSEVPTGTVNGVNAAFTLAAAPSPASSLFVFLNGALQKSGGEDYTLSSATITFASAPPSGSLMVAYYLRDAA